MEKEVLFKYGDNDNNENGGEIKFNYTINQLVEEEIMKSITTRLPICPQERMKSFERDYKLPMVSIAICMKNASKYLDETLFSIVMQTFKGPTELSIFDDASTDSSNEIILNWLPVFKYFKIMVVLSNRIQGPKIYNHDIKEYIEIIDKFNIGKNENEIVNSNSNNNGEKEEEKEEKDKKDNIITLLSGGVGYARNQSIKYSHGEYLCIQDADDIMFRERIEIQFNNCISGNDDGNNVLIGSNFIRIPIGSSSRYTDWCNRLSDDQLFLHQYREVTIIQPTWFLHRSLFEKNGKYIEALKFDDNITNNNNGNNGSGTINNNNNNNKDNFYLMGNNDNVCQYKHKNQEKHIAKYRESQNKFIQDIKSSSVKAIPEDLIFFNRHIENGGKLRKAKIITSCTNSNSNSGEEEEINEKKLKIEKFEPLLVYRYHESNTSNQIHKHMLMKVRIEYLERRVISGWNEFSIWGAGKDGKKFFTLLSDSSKKKVIAFCDVDKNKIGVNYNAAYTPYSIPVIHFTNVKSPIIICVALDRSNGEFENNLNSLNLIEGKDYWHFN